ncbi:MAG TPA: diacylglycerol kinase family protein [Polyangiaceae bacterium]|nr:diacylglycerol kinase family protein [Polyangiaceae bacterium]
MAGVSILVNPRAGSGSAGRKLAVLRAGLKAAGIEHEVLETRAQGHAADLAREARSASVIAVIGGDGTLNEVSQAYLGADGAAVPGPPLALIPCGTGGDFARTCAFRGQRVEHLIERIRARKRRPLDLGVLSLSDAEGKPLHRSFVNVTSAGISGEVDERVERGPKWLGGKWAFMLATLGAALAYRNVPVEIEIDGRPWYRGPILLAAIANGQFLGGGMHIAPQADWSDGLLDVICVGDLKRSEFLSQFPKVYQGTHLGLPSVQSTRGSTVSVRALRADRPVLVDVDGETPGYLPLTARLLPKALELAVD